MGKTVEIGGYKVERHHGYVAVVDIATKRAVAMLWWAAAGDLRKIVSEYVGCDEVSPGALNEALKMMEKISA